MSMSTFAKIGYTLIGVGIGLFGSSFILEHELNKPIGEVEDYIPKEDRENGENSEENRSILSESDQEGKTSNSKDIPQERGRSGREDRDRLGVGRDKQPRQGEDRRNSEFGSVQDDLYHFYESPEASLRKSGVDRKRAERSGKPVGKTDDGRQGSEADQRRKEFEARRSEDLKNVKTRYSKMYKSNGSNTGSDDMGDILHSVSERTDTRESYNRDPQYSPEKWTELTAHPEDDEPEGLSQFENDIHNEYNLEQLEGYFEVFIDDNPIEYVPLTYYAGDYTLCDDGEQIIPDPEDVVGMAALNRLIVGGPGVDNGVIFVHNMKTGIDYEVVLDNRAYKETVAGLFDEKMSSR